VGGEMNRTYGLRVVDFFVGHVLNRRKTNCVRFSTQLNFARFDLGGQ
jgi:hypothetical protein